MNTKQIPFGVVKWLELIWKADLPPNAKYLAAYLRTFMNDKSDMAWPSYARIIQETGLSRSTVAKYFQVLEGYQWLIRDRGCSNKNTRYHACIPLAVNEQLINDALGVGSTPHELRSTPDELHVVRHTDPNIQVNKQGNKQYIDQNEFDRMFEEFWNSGIRKIGRKDSKNILLKIIKTKPEKQEFIDSLVNDIKTRLNLGQLGFENMHPKTYLNGERWTDEKKGFSAEPLNVSKPDLLDIARNQ